MRVGVISPNLLLNVSDYNRMMEDPGYEWSFDLMAKKVALLFDKIFLTDDLELTFEIIGNTGEPCEGAHVGLLQFLASEGVLFQPRDLGYLNWAKFLEHNIRGEVHAIDEKLKKVGNPSNNCEPGDSTYVGQPDIGDFEAHDGTHPRVGMLFDSSEASLAKMKMEYEVLLLQRNTAILKQAGISDTAIIAEVPLGSFRRRQGHPVWRVLIREMPQMDRRAPWQDVLSFRDESRTQQCIRNLRLWTRKVVTEDLTENEIEDEIRSLVYEYEQHLRSNRLLGRKSGLTFLITGIAELSEIALKGKVARLGELISLMIESRFNMPEPSAPGYELALIPEIKQAF